jgi:hypothetical protein
MDAIEPHWISLLWFAAFATVCTLAFLVVAGMFPLRARPMAVKSDIGLLLVIGNAALLAVLSVATGLFGWSPVLWYCLRRHFSKSGRRRSATTARGWPR